MRVASLFSLLVLVLGCGNGATASGGRVFAPDWQNDGGKSIRAVQARVEKSALPAGTGVAVGVTANGLVGVGLDGSGRWTRPGRVDALPVVTGDVVVATAAGQLFALDAKSGRQLWSVPNAGRTVRGAGDDGSTTVVSLASPSGGGALLMAVARNGKVRQKLDVEAEIGAVGVQGDVAFVPWQAQYVSAVDLDSGNEIGRLLLREQVSHAINVGGSLYFGEIGLVRFDSKIGEAAAGQASSVRLPERELPGKPVWFTSGMQAVPAAAGAREKIRLFARPAPSDDKLGIAGGRYAATYFRIAMGLDAGDGSLKWVKTFERDVLGGAAAEGGFAFCDAGGKVTLVDSNGGESKRVDLGGALVGCAVQAGNFGVTSGKSPGSLPEQIAKAIEVRHTEMATAQRYLLRELGAMQDPLVTKALVELASNPRTPEFLLGDARQQLAARRDGAEYMLAALEKHYDFLSDILRSPPVGPMADALAAMNEARAAAPLAKHLNDAANTPDDIERAAAALTKLATAAQLDDLKTFFALYRATADDKELVNAVLSVAKALVRVGGAEGKRLVAEAAEDPLTHPDIKAGLAALGPASSEKSGPAEKPLTPEKTSPEPAKKAPAKKS